MALRSVISVIERLLFLKKIMFYRNSCYKFHDGLDRRGRVNHLLNTTIELEKLHYVLILNNMFEVKV